ncbi:hypothetical protein [Halalkalibacterium halodurans]|nr:hypothetical protein [Halalkalibacterium halodurans]
MDWEKLVLLLASISGIFAGVTTGMKNIQEMKAKRKRRPRSRKRRK